jgi:glycosyltransferase involved in cell wall biosynthesis
LKKVVMSNAKEEVQKEADLRQESVFKPVTQALLEKKRQRSGESYTVGCVPAFNEERNIASVVLTAQKFVDKVVVCDDGSTDLTSEIARRLGAIVIRHENNMGYGASLRSLFDKARELDADVAVTFDADGQHNPVDIPQVIKPILTGEADIVIGSRFLDEKSKSKIPGFRRNGIKIITNMTKAVSFNNITDAQSGYRAYGKKALNLVDPTEYGMGASTEILLKAKEQGLNVTEVPIAMKYDKDSNTHNPIYHGISVVLSTVKHYSIQRPLLFYGLPGVLVIMVAAFFWVWSLQILATSGALPTNMTLVAVLTTMVGLVLISTSVILWVLISVLREKR